MHRISNVTKLDIRALFQNGIDSGFLDVNMERYPYCGRLSDIVFLKRLYQLDKMPSHDRKFDNAEDDIWQHTINNNDDYPLGWIFDDNRFPLKSGTDEDYLKFICEVFHPEVRIEGGLCKSYFEKINSLLIKDGYELYEASIISGRSVYKSRGLSAEEVACGGFLPFSLRYKKALEKGSITLSINKAIRNDVISIMTRNEQQEDLVTETNLHYNKPTKEAVFDDLHPYYEPKCFDEIGKYSKAVDLEHFITNNYPQYVFDAIELYAKYSRDHIFQQEINVVTNILGWQLFDGKIMKSDHINIEVEKPQNDDNLNSLIQKAETSFKQGDSDNKQLALEKIWDALERLKTYYYPSDKKKSIEKVVFMISKGNDDLKQRIDNEFNELTDIGNNYQIKHFENGKMEIPNDYIKEYLYYRCLALINLGIKSIEK